MIITVRTLPRSDGRCSVVLTRDPGDPRDPEVVAVLPDDKAAVREAIGLVTRICRQAEGRLRSSEARSLCQAAGPSSYTCRMTIEVEPGEELVVHVLGS